ncbi:branched-chain amino acid aminotransferase [Adlercreutzia sp. ZJ141]|uniref:branched-chain amino acid aminotransferase n=1 Tax=Adlercreutzia sp. ZJ141 TaxID=2709406 RepID=UPI00210F73EE|nr:branched-chain amino acid aminotransferase [Adlercreutzia sp. ZJ141]
MLYPCPSHPCKHKGFHKETIPMEKKNLDWGNLGFAYMPADYSYVCNYRNGVWEEGGLTTEHSLTLSECAGIFHYCQEIFEGLKAYTAENGDIVCFRPDLNAQRMGDSAQRLCMPPFPEDRFVEAVKEVVRANAAWVPPFGSGATLYIRPFMIATGNVIGVKPADEYQFRIFVTPVGPYFKGGDTAITITVADYDRAAPHGTGNIKAGLNYAMSLYPGEKAHAAGYSENLYLDSQTRTYVEETGGANVLFVDKQGDLIVPQSATDSILPSITRRSLVTVAKDYLGLTVIERPVKFEEVLNGDFVECGLCGTAAVISPVGHIEAEGVDVTFPDGTETSGPVMKKLRATLTDIQAGKIEGPDGWVVKIL